MKKIVGITGIVGICLFLFSKCETGTELEISFVASQKHDLQVLSQDETLNHVEWIIISSEGQAENWRKEGYMIPTVDFNEHYLIISRYKILRLYQKPGIDECSGVPDGKAVFDKTNSGKNVYYFYLMPTILLVQGVG